MGLEMAKHNIPYVNLPAQGRDQMEDLKRIFEQVVLKGSFVGTHDGNLTSSVLKQIQHHANRPGGHSSVRDERLDPAKSGCLTFVSPPVRPALNPGNIQGNHTKAGAFNRSLKATLARQDH